MNDVTMAIIVGLVAELIAKTILNGKEDIILKDVFWAIIIGLIAEFIAKIILLLAI